MRWVRAIAAALAMLTVIGGAPVLLLGWGSLGPGWWRADDGSLLVTVLTVAGWLAWLAFTLATVLEVIRFASGNRFIPDLPLLGGLQALCAGLVLAVVAVAASSGGSADTRAEGSGRPASVLAERSDAAPVTPQRPRANGEKQADRPASGGTELGRGSTTLATTVDDQAETGLGYTVAAGDDLWSVAERLLGEGRRWREIARANPELLSDPTSQLAEGSRLVLPDTPRAAEPQPNGPRKVTVRRGDTLSGLAEQYLGNSGRWPRIAAANADLISDPDHIEVGWRLTIPEQPRKEPAPETDEVTSTVEPAVPTASPPVTGPAIPPSPADRPTGTPSPRPVPTPTSISPPANPSTDAPAMLADQALIGGLGALAAAGLFGGWQARRLLQSRIRPAGRRVLHPDDTLARLHTAVGRRQQPDLPAVLDAALRAIGRHCHQTGQPLPELAQATLTTERIGFAWAAPAGTPPAGFDGDQSTWWLGLPADGSNPLGPVEHPCAFPALVSLGTGSAGETVLVDLERSGVVGVAAEQRELQLANLASIAVELACAPWAAELALVSVGASGELARVAGGESVTWVSDSRTALERLRRQHAQRQEKLAGQDLRRLRADPERSDAAAPQIYVFHDPLTAAQRQHLDDLLSGSRLGIAAVVAVDSAADAQWELFGDPLRPIGRFHDETLTAHAIPESTRTAVSAWYHIAETTETEPAPWWSDEDASNLRLLPSRHAPSEDPVDIVSLRRPVRPHPTLLLIGPIRLEGTAGPEPGRARYQLIELCSWLLEHPGRTATEMATGLGIAETTRRSNLSRLRTWLGADPEGEAYLPEAYSGRIRLHPEVSSDILQLRLLTGPGVNRISEDGLVGALELIRGGMLADAAPGQWFWAETLRSDVAATLRDAALVLVDRALHRDELDLARWAAERALLVTPEDELLLGARIRTEHAAGNRPGVERHVLHLTQQARVLGVDLLPQTVLLCQQVMEGRTRARRA